MMNCIHFTVFCIFNSVHGDDRFSNISPSAHAAILKEMSSSELKSENDKEFIDVFNIDNFSKLTLSEDEEVTKPISADIAHENSNLVLSTAITALYDENLTAYFNSTFKNYDAKYKRQIRKPRRVTEIYRRLKHIRRSKKRHKSSRRDRKEFWEPSLGPYRRIYNGHKTKIKHFPFLVTVHVLGRFVCSGTIIKSDLVITAAFCLKRWQEWKTKHDELDTKNTTTSPKTLTTTTEPDSVTKIDKNASNVTQVNESAVNKTASVSNKSNVTQVNESAVNETASASNKSNVTQINESAVNKTASTSNKSNVTQGNESAVNKTTSTSNISNVTQVNESAVNKTTSTSNTISNVTQVTPNLSEPNDSAVNKTVSTSKKSNVTEVTESAINVTASTSNKSSVTQINESAVNETASTSNKTSSNQTTTSESTDNSTETDETTANENRTDIPCANIKTTPPPKQSPLAVRVGTNYYRQEGKVVNVVDVYFHPEYNPLGLKNNLAIMRLERHLNFTHTRVKKIYISKVAANITKGTNVTIVGWGAKTFFNKVYNALWNVIHKANLTVTSRNECKNYTGYSKYVKQTNFCALSKTEKQEGACDCDMGDPGVVGNRLVGVTSFIPQRCGIPNTPTVFTNVGYYTDWIEEIMDIGENSSVPWWSEEITTELNMNSTDLNSTDLNSTNLNSTNLNSTYYNSTNSIGNETTAINLTTVSLLRDQLEYIEEPVKNEEHSILSDDNEY